ncbi:hypothetical protein QMK33_11760 [Hymenobacter sp. H14-R3]|uniref:hypothetical protein n=1 Tax=Hymenobacter sp. H14-R3 TaxID=3046308 RepID=UPI0024BB5730|nr:hypothetical protein [Hymenobacter sp. H14-R3]MDJ0365829.1 hypothetical protein [Hymenobacter sp. H14-R3]
MATALVRPWQRLRPAQRRVALGLLLAAVAVRVYYAGYYPLSLDEIASYDYWVLPGAAVTASYYPFPNNHVLPNLLVGLVHTLAPAAPPQLALRLLPTLLGLLTLPVVYALLLRHLRFGVATLGLGLYWLSPLAAYYAVAGRGYAWTLVAALAGLFATLELLRPAGRRPVRQLAWAVFGLSGALGLYAVPTHVYALLGLGLALLVGFGRGPARARPVRLVHLAVATLGIALVAGVLYAPIGAVSGWPALLANPYVARQAWPEFRLVVGPFLVGTATELLGQRGLSAAAYGLLLLVGPVALWRGQLPAPARRLGWVLYAQLLLWLPLSVAQHVLPPARTLLLVLLAFFLLLALLAQVGWAYWQGIIAEKPGLRTVTGPPGLRLGVLVLVLGAYGGYRLHREQAVISVHTRQQAALREAYAWLRTQPLRRVWVEPRAYALFWQHYALSAGQRPLPLRVVYDVPAARPGPRGEVEALPAGSLPAVPVRYRNELVRIIPVSPTQPLIQY